jgi:hypothetical protein
LEHRNQFLWKIAVISGLESMAYLFAWNYSLFNGKGETMLCGFILFSLTPLVSTLLSFVLSYLSHAIFGRSTAYFEYWDTLIRALFSQTIDDSPRVVTIGPVLYAVFSLSLYAVSKLILILFAVNDVFYLPDEAYQVAIWANYFPHIF